MVEGEVSLREWSRVWAQMGANPCRLLDTLEVHKLIIRTGTVQLNKLDFLLFLSGRRVHGPLHSSPATRRSPRGRPRLLEQKTLCFPPDRTGPSDPRERHRVSLAVRQPGLFETLDPGGPVGSQTSSEDGQWCRPWTPDTSRGSTSYQGTQTHSSSVVPSSTNWTRSVCFLS